VLPAPITAIRMPSLPSPPRAIDDWWQGAAAHLNSVIVVLCLRLCHKPLIFKGSVRTSRSFVSRRRPPVSLASLCSYSPYIDQSSNNIIIYVVAPVPCQAVFTSGMYLALPLPRIVWCGCRRGKVLLQPLSM
jgi:hypothetical protein